MGDKNEKSQQCSTIELHTISGKIGFEPITFRLAVEVTLFYSSPNGMPDKSENGIDRMPFYHSNLESNQHDVKYRSIHFLQFWQMECGQKRQQI